MVLLSLIHISEPTRLLSISYAVFCLKKKMITDPKGVSYDLLSALLAEFTPEQIVELTATITAAMGFSKAAVAFGPPPDLSLIHISEPTRLLSISYAVF